MTITSIAFTGFVAAVLLVYYALPQRRQNQWLLLTSLIFCFSWSWRFALVLLISATINALLGRTIIAERDRERRRLLLRLGIAFNGVVWLIFKTADFYVPQTVVLLSRLGIQDNGGLLLLLPIGLSYYTLENISYLVDSSRRQTPKDTPLLDYLLYVAYFPKLIAGPIERARSFLPQLSRPRRVTQVDLSKAGMLIGLGLLRKTVVANQLLSLTPPQLLVNPARLGLLEIVYWAGISVLTIYNDFAGYTNIVRGVSLLFGIELTPNFRWPLFARNFTELWNRWHISLSTWLRDYVYYPVNRALLRRKLKHRNLLALSLPPLITMAASGIWHQISPHMLLWGVLNGLFIVGEQLLGRGKRARSPDEWPLWRQLLGTARIWVLFSLAGAFFVLEIPQALALLRALVQPRGLGAIASPLILRTLPLALAILTVDWMQWRNRDEFIFLRWPRSVQSVAYAAALLLILMNGLFTTTSPVIYQEF